MSEDVSHAARSSAFNPSKTRLVVTIEARMTSTRLPGKVMADLGGLPMVELMVRRLQGSQTISDISIATTTNYADDPLAAIAERLEVNCYRGSEDDVLLRVLEAATQTRADVIVEVTGDCPFIDPGLLDACVLAYFGSDVHYCANNRVPGLPRGLDVQVFSTDVLSEVNRISQDPADHEHVSLHIYEHPERYTILSLPAVARLSRPSWRWTIDTVDDLRFAQSVVDALGHDFSAAEAVAWLDRHPDVVALNAQVRQKPVRR